MWKVKTEYHDHTVQWRHLELRQKKAEKGQNLLKSDISASQLPDSTTCYTTINLQQVMFVPTSTRSDMFNRRQLLCYNCTICVGNTQQSYVCGMKLYSEGEVIKQHHVFSRC